MTRKSFNKSIFKQQFKSIKARNLVEFKRGCTSLNDDMRRLHQCLKSTSTRRLLNSDRFMRTGEEK